ncbi:hypothetical protein [Aquisalimonas asiatica]|uniref:Lipoprotein n=1 Tax=Aquisalimonas asiatica TaxID=406100 RepID=A0A1H8VU46_9GAMM|nr:hypothetical protein [Aquisalimonas asiatica]SEP18820.1 hypothetical protein SAMN04488052_11537 [Aquisalimonas asiatica]
MHATRLALVTLSIALLAGCATTSHPLGMTEDEWARLSPEQQLDARQHQAELDQEERARRAEAARLAAEQERLEQDRREARLRDAGPGEVVHCVLQDAEGYLGGDWRTAEPVGFAVLRGDTKVIDIPEIDRSTRRVQAEARYNGAQVELCRPNRNTCTTLAATPNQLQRGVERHIDLERVARGTLYCDTPAHRTRTRHRTSD